MNDDWTFWQEQVEGKTPETTPGTPHQGYYLYRRRTTHSIPVEEMQIGGSRKRVTTTHEPVAIWHDETGFHCLINGDVHLTDVEQIDNIFSRCCRNAITYTEYCSRTETEPEAEKPFNEEIWE